MKTTLNQKDPATFLGEVENDQRREDAFAVMKLMEELTGEPARMWGDSIVGFGQYHYKYESGREGEFFLTGFSPRKTSLTLYIMTGFSRYPELLSKLGKFKTGKSCLYLKKLSDADLEVLKELIIESVTYMKQKYPSS